MTAYSVGPREARVAEPLNVFQQSNRLPRMGDPDKGMFRPVRLAHARAPDNFNDTPPLLIETARLLILVLLDRR